MNIPDIIACRLSGQIPDAAWQEHLKAEPELRAAWEARQPVERPATGTLKALAEKATPGPWAADDTAPGNLAASMAARCQKFYPSPDGRVGIRSGLHDGAHLCDAIAKAIQAGGRKSKARMDMAAVASQCGNALWEMAKLIEVPPADTLALIAQKEAAEAEAARLREALALLGPVAFAASNYDERASEDHINALVGVTAVVMRNDALRNAIDECAALATPEAK